MAPGGGGLPGKNGLHYKKLLHYIRMEICWYRGHVTRAGTGTLHGVLSAGK